MRPWKQSRQREKAALKSATDLLCLLRVCSPFPNATETKGVIAFRQEPDFLALGEDFVVANRALHVVVCRPTHKVPRHVLQTFFHVLWDNEDKRLMSLKLNISNVSSLQLDRLAGGAGRAFYNVGTLLREYFDKSSRICTDRQH